MKSKTDVEYILDAIGCLSGTIEKLGLNGAATPMGAIELHANELKKGAERIAHAIDGLTHEIGRIVDVIGTEKKGHKP